MTEAASRRRRWPKGRVRALAWGTGGAAFIMAAAPLVAAPKPPDVASGHQVKGAAPPRQVIERHITRRVVIVDPVVSTPVYTGGSEQHLQRGRSDLRQPGAGAGSPHDQHRRVLIAMESRTFRSMGTDVTVVGPAHPAFDDAAEVMVDRFTAEDRRFSRFRGDSELTRVNRSDDEWTPVSDGFAEVLELALAAAAATDGTFDPDRARRIDRGRLRPRFRRRARGRARRAPRRRHRADAGPRSAPGLASLSTRGRASGPRRDREGMVLGSRRRGRDRHGSAMGAGERGW